MKLFSLLIAVFISTSSLVLIADEKLPVDYVNPLIGTPFAGFHDHLEGGGTMPCVGWPFAMTNFVAQTDQNRIGRMPYVYEDSHIIGFTATHQPTVWMGDYGYVSIMPAIGKLKVLPYDRALPFSHTSEIAKPEYYAVTLDAGEDAIKAEIAAASRCGMFRFTFPASDDAHIIVQAINNTDTRKPYEAFVNIDPEKGQITGYNPDQMGSHLVRSLENFKGYFIIQFSKPFSSYGTWSDDTISASQKSQTGRRMGAYVSFSTSKDEQVTARIATSFISLEQARTNLENEIPNWDFDSVVQATRDKWQHELARIELDGATEDQKAIFYTAMFHTMLFPREFSEYGSYYSAFDDMVHEGISYNDFSLWDTFRAVHPLYHFIQPERVSPMIQAMLQMYQQGGWLPKWPNPTYSNIMIGTHADSVIADAYIKGFRDYNIQLAYDALRKDAFEPPYGDTASRWGDRQETNHYEARGGLSWYHSLGYVPEDKANESVSRTIEFSYDDFCIAQMAQALGKDYDYNRLIKTSTNYRNLYNPQTGFFAPRFFNGSWCPSAHWGFSEGSPWTYRFGALHDIPGMISLMGGKQKFAALLEQNFSEAHYRHDNEPGHHYIYLFDYCDMPRRTQELIRKHTSSENYRNAPLGLNGNDDCGQMSAWYIFSVMGFYPVTPGTDIFALGAPQYPAFKLHHNTPNTPRTLEIIAKNLSQQNKYVHSVTLDDKPITTPFITYSQLINAKKLTFEMTH